MVAAIELTATAGLEALQPALEAALARLQERLNALPPEDVVAVVDGTARALASVDELPTAPAAVEALSGGRVWSVAERVEAEVEVLARSFARRRALLEDALTASQVAACSIRRVKRRMTVSPAARCWLYWIVALGASRFGNSIHRVLMVS